MESSSPFLHPAFLLTASGLIVGLILWFGRLEFKTNANSTELIKSEAERAELWRELERHKENSDIHFNQKVSAEVDRSNSRRFETIERQLGDINHKLDQLAEKTRT